MEEVVDNDIEGTEFTYEEQKLKNSPDKNHTTHPI